jgi:pimeloyl-ACP methyl ester carboxylesterase
LVLLHGFCEDARVWQPLLPGLEGLPLLRIDLPGFGQSALPTGGVGMQAHAEAVEAVLNAEDVERAVVLGHSMGGYAALAFAARWPERVAGLSLLHSHPLPDSPERVEARQRGIEMLRQGKRDLYVAQLFAGLFAPAFAAERPDIVAQLTHWGKAQSPEAIIAALEAMIGRSDQQHSLRSLPCPLQVIAGAEDALMPPAVALRAAALASLADAHLLPGVGHMGMWEAPDLVARLVRGFYAEWGQ